MLSSRLKNSRLLQAINRDVKVFHFLFILVFSCSTNTFANELVVRHKQPLSKTDFRTEYYLDVLRLALRKTEASDGPFRLEQSSQWMKQGRTIISLRDNQLLDVVWTMTSIDREEWLLPIRIPLLKGLLGYRVFIIRKGDEERFAAVETIADLNSFVAAQGYDWPDTEILKANGLKVISGTSYEGLFSMLERGRFDYFPRGVNEPWKEVKVHEDKKLVVEDTLLIQYPAPIYFFVNRKNANLADRLERGLHLAIKDGSFNQLLYSHHSTKGIFEQAHIEKRKIFRLKNPLLSEESAALLNESQFWYVPGEEKL